MPPAADSAARLQRTLGDQYTVERELGGGGMSHTFVARDNALGRRVVVKVLSAELAATVSLERFKREILLAAALQHPHIVGVLSAGEVEGVPYFIMPFVEGESLRAHLQRHGPMQLAQAVSVLRDVARALAYAHAQGVVHRDIKPDNILLAQGAAMVADFGVAKAIADARVRRETPHAEPHTITLAGTSLGTPAYMAPEQAAGDATVDHRADLYAFGVMAFEMVAGAPPFAGQPSELLRAHLTDPPPPLAARRPDVTAALDALISRCLEKDPAKRPASAEELVRLLDDPALVSGAYPSAPHRSVALSPRMRAGSGPSRWVAGALALAVVAVGAWVVTARGRATAPTTPSAATAPAAADPARSIAVLPFVNIGPDSSDQYLADGMTDGITSAVGALGGWRVASRTAAVEALRSGAGPTEIGRLLGVGSFLEGTVQRDGDQLRVTARLVSTADGFTVWSEVFDQTFTNRLAVQDTIARRIAEALGPEIGAAEGTTRN